MTYVELATTTNFSFLRGASHPEELAATAAALGYAGIGITDHNSVAGWCAPMSSHARTGGDARAFKVAAGARLVFSDGTPDILAYPLRSRGLGRLCRMLTQANMRAERQSPAATRRPAGIPRGLLLIALEGAAVPDALRGDDARADLAWTDRRIRPLPASTLKPPDAGA